MTVSARLADKTLGGAAALIKTGAGKMMLTANNTFTGNVTINDGILDVASNGLYRTSAGADAFTNTAVITINAGGTLKLNSYAYNGNGGTGGLADYAGRRVLNGGTIEVVSATHSSGNDFTVNASGGTFRYNPTVTSGTLTLNGNANTNIPIAGTLTLQADGHITINEVVEGAGGITKTGAQTLTLAGVNTYTGPTAVNAGTLSINTIKDLSASSAIGAPTTAANGLISLGSATTTGTLRYTGTVQSTDRTIQIGTNSTTPAVTDIGGATIQNDGAAALTFSAATFNTPTNATTGVGADRTLTLQGSSVAANTISGIIQDNVVSGSGTGTATVALTKAGAGTWVLGGANTYTGLTTVANGTLSINGVDATASNPQALGENPSVALGVAATSSGILSYTGGTGTLAKAVSVLGNGSDALQNNGAGVLTLSGGITGSNTTLTISGTGETTVASAFAVNLDAASGALIKDGAGILNIDSGAQTYKTLTTTAGAGTTNVNVALTATGGTDVVANAKLRFGSVSQTLSSLTIGAGSTVIFTSGVASGAFSGGGGKGAAFGGTAAVPEPGTLGLLLVGALGVLNRRRRQV